MATQTLFRVLFAEFDNNSTPLLPLVDEVHGFDSLPQEFCGWGYEGDFTEDAEENGRYGQIWEFVTNQPMAMRAALNADSNVITFTVKEA